MNSPSPVVKVSLPPLRPYQTAILTSRALDDLTVSAPQLGKTATLQVWLLSSALQHGADPRPWWWVAPTYSQARHGYGGLCDMARRAGLLRPSDYTTSVPLRAQLVSGGIIEARSWDNPRNLFGPTVLGVAVDEFGQLNRGAYQAISSRRAETITQGLGYARYAGNVGEIGGPAEELWRQAESGADPRLACRRWTWRDRALAHDCPCGIEPDLLTAADHAPACPRGQYVLFIRAEQQRMSAPQFRTLYDAEWADWNDLPVYSFDRHRHVDDSVAHSGYEIDLACDFNVDPMAWTVGGHSGRESWCFDEITIPGGATTRQACREFIRRYPDRKLSVNLFGDASGGARKTSASQTDYDIIREMIGGYYQRLRVRVPKGNPRVGDRINAFNALLEHDRWTCHSRCRGLIDDLARVSYKPGTRDVDKSDKSRTHHTDAEGSRVVELFPVRAPGRVATVSRSDRFVDPIAAGRF